MRPREARAPQLLSQGALEPMFHAKPLGRNREQPLLAATRGGPRTAVKTPHSQKQIINKDCLQVEMEEEKSLRVLPPCPPPQFPAETQLLVNNATFHQI